MHIGLRLCTYYRRVSNPIREYLQIITVQEEKTIYWWVSNPIREYLQIQITIRANNARNRFKPYKGVSSNLTVDKPFFVRDCFKPYKGVSSNSAIEYEIQDAKCFKPYKGVSSNSNQIPRFRFFIWKIVQLFSLK